jgi:hypothetical protein
LPAFISKTRALTDQLPENEKTILLVEKEARLIQAAKPEGTLPAGLGIQFIGNASDYYVKVKPEYTLKLSSNFSDNFTGSDRAQHGILSAYCFTK